MENYLREIKFSLVSLFFCILVYLAHFTCASKFITIFMFFKKLKDIGRNTLKIIHCADLHLDSSLTANFNAGQTKERKLELINSFERLLRYADENLVDAVIIAGDLFDKPIVSKTTKNIVLDGITRLKDIDFYYLKGNHDEFNSLDQLRNLPENLHLFNNEWQTYTAFSSDYYDITISGKELTSRDSNLNLEGLELEASDFNIVCLHGQLTGYESKKDDINIPLNGLVGKNIDYLALGHIHKESVGEIDSRGIYAYSGALEGRGFDELGEKGFILLNIDEENHSFTHEFIPFAKRTLEEVWVDITDAYTSLDVIELATEAINEANIPKTSLIKLVLVGEVLVEADINENVIKRHFENDFFYIKIVNDSRFKLNISDYAHEESLKGEFVRLIATDKELSNKDKMQIINIGIKALTNDLGKQDYEIN